MSSPVREAFDRHAAAYDEVFLSAGIRSEVWEMTDRLFSPGMNLLDLGCGTGDDALHFSERGVNVTAVDISAGMISRLRRKATGAVRSEIADMRGYRSPTPLHGVFSNFGALNCVPQLDWIPRLPLVPGGYLVLTLMGRLYPLECAVALLKGEPRVAFRRLRRAADAVVEGVRFTVYYHSLRSIRKTLGSRFELIGIRGLCSLRPAPHLQHLRRFRAIRRLEPLDRWLCSHRLTAPFSDHYVSVWRQRET